MFPRERGLTTSEKNLAKTVFQDRLPYSWIRIKDDLGWENRAWTEPGIIGHFILHMGPVGYSSCTSTNPIITNGEQVRRVFIHELTHAWQGFNGLNFVADSLFNQCKAAIGGDVGAAYSYTVGNAWSTYNCEQQGSIVEDWFRLGLSTDNSRFRYIRDNIRKGRVGES